jgi:hypothetical protein
MKRLQGSMDDEGLDESAKRATARAGPSRRVVALAAMVVVVAVGWAWRPMLAASFQRDDYAKLRELEDGTPLSRTLDHAFGAFSRGHDSYWRPGWHAMEELAYALGGMEPAPWYALAIALHLLLVVALFAALLRLRVPVELAAAGALAFGVAPGYGEAVGWLSAALNVLPCALLLLVAGVAILRWLEGADARALAAAFAAFALSFAFKEAGYHVPLLIGAGAVALGRSRVRRLASVAAAALLFGAVVLAHYFLLNRTAANELPAQDRLFVVLRFLRQYVVGVAGGGLSTARLAGVTIAWLALLLTGSPRTRFLLAWAAVALFPYAFRAAAPRFAIFFELPLWAGVVSWLADRVDASMFARAPVAARAGAAALLLALAAWSIVPLRAEQRTLIEPGEQCRAAAASLRAIDFAGARTLVADDLAPGLLHALPSIVVLEARRRAVAAPAVRILQLFPRPPFLLVRDSAFESIGEPACYVHVDLASGRITRTTWEELTAGRVAVPMYALRHEALVVPEPQAALRRIASREVDLSRTVVLSAEPAPPFRASPGAAGSVTIHDIPEPTVADLDVTTASDAFLVLHVWSDITRTGSVVEVDGAPAPILHADALFNAVRIAPGSHRVRLILRGNLLKGVAPR